MPADLPVAAPDHARIVQLHGVIHTVIQPTLDPTRAVTVRDCETAHAALDDLAAVAAALLAERQQDCPAGNECAINSGASHCFHCRRNWPRDETWDQPFLERANLQRREIETLHGLLDVAEAERQQDKERIERLETALREAQRIIQTGRGDSARLADSGRVIAAALAVEEDAE